MKPTTAESVSNSLQGAFAAWNVHLFRTLPVGFAAGLLLNVAACGGGGGSTLEFNPKASSVSLEPMKASDLAVLIADGDPTSEAIGVAYQKARGIPDVNMIRLKIPRGSDVISLSDFAVMKSNLDLQMPATVQATLLTWTQPSRVVGSTCSMGITSALALGYDAKLCGSCVFPTASPYFNSDSRKPWTDLGIRPSMMLGVDNVADALALISRGVASDGIMLSGAFKAQAWLMRTDDVPRSSRYPDFQTLAGIGASNSGFHALVNVPATGVDIHYVDNSKGQATNEITGQTNVMFYLTGLTGLQFEGTNSYLPGAVADSLTSYSGYLPDGLFQMPITAWLKAGLTGSYGTQEEPCAFTAKFPQASVLISHYGRGETLIESYWKSVQAPGQGLFIGEPLARPWGTTQ